MSEASLKPSLYKDDFYAWALDQADLLRAMVENRGNVPLDLENLIDEVEGLAIMARAGVRSQTRRILEHLLKLEFSPTQNARHGWRKSIIEARARLSDEITPTLRNEIAGGLAREYARARRAADYGLRAFGEIEAANRLPDECPYTLEQIEAEEWYPQPRSEISE